MRISWGHEAAQASAYEIKPVPGAGVEIQSVVPRDLESGEAVKQGVARTRAGGGDVDALDLVVVHPKEPSGVTQNVHILWTDLIAASDPDTAQRLARDPSFRTRPSMLTIQMDAEGTKGFSVSIDQLKTERALWIPSLGVYVTATTGARRAREQPVAFADHLKALASRKGQRILDRVKHEPEATDAQFLARWEDMGSPLFSYPEQRGPGHIVGITWDSAIRKFGIDRAGGVWNDEGNPDKFRFWLSVGDLARGVAHTWKGQRLTDGLPILTTTFEEDGLRYELEQFAYPLDGPPAERRGDIPMVLMQQVTVRELRGAARRVPVSMAHRRLMPPYLDDSIETYRQGSALLFREQGRRGVLLAVEGGDGEPLWNGTRDYQSGPNRQKRVDATVFLDVPANGTRQFVVKLPSPMVDAEKAQTLAAIDYARAREATLKFWSDYVARGAQFKVPEQRVNDLFRANLWHALRLPRRHGGRRARQGHHRSAVFELRLQPDRHAVAGESGRVCRLHALRPARLSRDFDRGAGGAVPQQSGEGRSRRRLRELAGLHAGDALRRRAELPAVERSRGVRSPAAAQPAGAGLVPRGDRARVETRRRWCVERARQRSAQRSDGRRAVGLQSGVSLRGTRSVRPRARTARPRACRGSAQDGRTAPRDPSSARSAPPRCGRRSCSCATARGRPTCRRKRRGRVGCVDDWYATDVDTGAVHLLRLKALPARGVLADSLLHDHEDNLFYKGWGMANEPVYNQQATAYLLRDEPEAAIRAFYSMMSCAFSHSAFEPVEHRWTHGQYFGPPSTDGAWFELYRNMLVHERDGDVLALAQAAPRAWLQDGKTIELQRVPTYYGPMSLTMTSKVGAGELRADVQMPGVSKPKTLLVRFRHPEKKPMRGVTVNGRAWTGLRRFR